MEKLRQQLRPGIRGSRIFLMVVVFVASLAVRGTATVLDGKSPLKGAIAEQIGSLVLSQNTLIIQLDLTPLREFPLQLKSTRDKVSLLRQDVDKMEKDIGPVIQDRLDQVLILLDGLIVKPVHFSGSEMDVSFSDFFDTTILHDKRYTEKSQRIVNLAKDNDKVMKISVTDISNLNAIMNQLSAKLQSIKEFLSEVHLMSNTSEMYLDIFMKVKDFNNYVLDLIRHYETLLHGIFLSNMGVVTPSLIPESVLAEYVRTTRTKYGFNPISTMNDISHYYSLLTVELFQKSIFISVPFSGKGFYSVFKLRKFPVSFANSLYTPDINEDALVVVSHDHDVVSFPSERVLSQCEKSSEHNMFGKHIMYVCPTGLFIWSSLFHTPHHFCALSFLPNMPIKDACLFQPITVEEVYIKHVAPLWYFYFPVKMLVLSVTCPSHKPYSLQVQGAYVLPDFCGIITSDFKTLPSSPRLQENIIQLLNMSLTAIDMNLTSQPKLVSLENVETTQNIGWDKITVSLLKTAWVPLLIVILIMIIVVLGVVYLLCMCCESVCRLPWCYNL